MMAEPPKGPRFPTTSGLKEGLAQIGMPAADSVRLAQGVVGKSSVVVAIAIVMIGAIAIRSATGQTALIFAGLIAVLLLIYFGLTFWFSYKNPGIALLEGAHLVQWRQMDLASNQLPPVIDHTPTTAPQSLSDL